jgi:hypothetical protein
MRKATSYLHLKALQNVHENNEGEKINDSDFRKQVIAEKLDLASGAYDAIEGVISSLEKE